jgi:hypothetical protein
MKYETIEEIYAGNERVRNRLHDLLSKLTPEQATALPEDEKWTIAQIVEHISIVDENTIKICAKLLKKAQEDGQASDGKATMSDSFLAGGQKIAGIKVEAPSIVQPTGDMTIDDSLAKLEATAERARELRDLFETIGGTEHKFPHPFFGDISAHEWLALKGGHEMRHIKQIEKVLAKIQ